MFELGGFYLNGVDEALAGRCVGSKLLLSWPSSPELEVGTTDDVRLLPAGSALEMEIDVRTIKCRHRRTPTFCCRAADGSCPARRDSVEV